MAAGAAASNFGFFLLSAAITLAVEAAVANSLLDYLKIRKKDDFLIAVAAGNLITVPIAWFLVPTEAAGFAGFLWSELLALALETLIIYRAVRRRINLNVAAMISIIMNISSAVIGTGVLYMLSGFYVWLLQ